MANKSFTSWGRGRFTRLFVGARASAEPSLSDGDLTVERQLTTARLSVGAADVVGSYATAAERAKFNCDGTNPPTCEALRMQDQQSGAYYRVTISAGAWQLTSL